MTFDSMKEIVQIARARKPLRITYDEVEREIEVHAFGLTRAGKPAIRAFQTRNEKYADDYTNGWKLLHVDKIGLLSAMDGTQTTIRPEFNPNDAQLATVLWHIALN